MAWNTECRAIWIRGEFTTTLATLNAICHFDTRCCNAVFQTVLLLQLLRDTRKAHFHRVKPIQLVGGGILTI